MIRVGSLSIKNKTEAPAALVLRGGAAECVRSAFSAKHKKVGASNMKLAPTWSECRDSNSGPPEPKSGTLPTALHPDGVRLGALRSAASQARRLHIRFPNLPFKIEARWLRFCFWLERAHFAAPKFHSSESTRMIVSQSEGKFNLFLRGNS